MRKKNNTLLWISAVLVIGILVFSGFKLGWFSVKQTMPGFTTLSLTQADLRSSSSYLDGKQWILTVRQGGLAQSAEGIIDADEVGYEYPGDEKPQYDFGLSMDYNYQNCEYDIKTDTSKTAIFKFNYDEFTSLIVPSTATCAQHCSSGTVVACGKLGASFTGVCVSAITQANAVGYFESPTIVSDLTVTANAKGETYTTNINTKQKIKDTLGPYAYVIWQGNMDTGRSCSNSGPYTPIYWGGKWKIFSSSLYGRYESSYDSVHTSIASGTYSSSSTAWANIKAAIDVNNERVEDLYSNQQSFGTITNSASITGGMAKLQVTDTLQYPVLTFYVKTSWLGIYTPVSKPQIVSASSDCFTTGSTGSVKAQIKNIGDEGGNIDVWLDCPSPFAGERTEIYIKSGETKTTYIPITASTDSKTVKSCTLHAQGTVDEVTSSVSVCVNAPDGICTPGEVFCDGKEMRQCDSTGQSSTLIKVCADKCVKTGVTTAECEGGESNGTGVCEDKLLGVVPGDWKTTQVEYCDDILCKLHITTKKTKDVEGCVYDWTGFTILVVVIMIGLLMFFAFGPMKKGRKKISKK